MNRQEKIGVCFSVVHLVVFVWFLYYLDGISGSDAQGPLLWVYWLVIDFPVSLLVILLFAIDVTSHYMLYFVHGVLGTIWWYFVPTIVGKGVARFIKRVRFPE